MKGARKIAGARSSGVRVLLEYGGGAQRDSELLLGAARRGDLTLRRACEVNARAPGICSFAARRCRVVDVMQTWSLEGAADGFNVMPGGLPGFLTEFVGLVVPELQHRRRYRPAYGGPTLREPLGLTLRPARLRA